MKGFEIAYSSASDGLIEKISMIHAKKERPVYFSSHCLGASRATIASLDVILSLNIEDIYVVTFGRRALGICY